MMPTLLDTDTNVLDTDMEMIHSAARQCLMELEGLSTKYSPIFGNEFRCDNHLFGVFIYQES